MYCILSKEKIDKLCHVLLAPLKILISVPSPAPYDKKMPEGKEPRHFEDEGFYVGKPPPVAPSNLNIMENRLMEGDQVSCYSIFLCFVEKRSK